MVLKFYKGANTEDNLQCIREQGGRKVKDIYLLPDGSLIFLTDIEDGQSDSTRYIDFL